MFRKKIFAAIMAGVMCAAHVVPAQGAAEAVERTYRDGDDLVVILVTGGRLVISDFYDTATAESRDLVLRDPNNGTILEV